MKTALITGIGGDIGQNIAMIIREDRPHYKLIGVDMNLRHAGSLFVDEFIRVPSASSEIYLDSLREIIDNNSVDIIIPTTESELLVFGPLINELGFQSCISAGNFIISTCIDKLLTIKFLKSLGIPTPWTISSENELPNYFPCIFKPQISSGSKNIFKVENTKEALFLSTKFSKSIFQELLEPENKEVTCAVYRRSDGKIFVLQMLRKLIGGLTGWAKVIHNDEIHNMCEKIAIGMDLHGSINIQLRITNEGPRIFEINPRFSSTVLMRHRIGFSDLIWAIDESEGILASPPEIKINQTMVRVQDYRNLVEKNKYADK